LWYACPAQIFAEHLTVPRRSRKSYQNGSGRSKLAPHIEQIRAWQAKGMTLREIAAELQKYGCTTTA
jgi:DNA-binding transcriptional MerR regulator